LKLTTTAITRQFLIDSGWTDSPELNTIILHAQKLISEKGIDTKKYLIKTLKRDFPDQHASLCMRDQPAPLSLAIEANSPESIKNLKLAQKQITELLRCPVVRSGSLMPDACPAGSAAASMPVGGAIAVENAIIPAAHSSDICCSLLATFYHSEMPADEQVDTLMQHTRFGPGGRSKPEQIPHPVLNEPVWLNPFLKGLEAKAQSHIADQGDGNHFAFLGVMQVNAQLLQTLRDHEYHDLADQLSVRDSWNVIVTHHGSRSLGSTLFTRGLDAAIKQTRIHARDIPDEAAWLSMDTKQGQDYWDALQYLSRWTKTNHQMIHQKFIEAIGSKPVTEIGNEHNFVWQKPDSKTYLHGKGATPAWLCESGNPLLGLIPLNMAEPILLTLGSNNVEHLSFSPHGAGRNMSRRALLRRYTKSKKTGFDQKLLEQDIAEGTAGIEVRWYQGRPDITETPRGYKPAETVREQIKQFGLAEIIAEISPLASIMSGRAETFEKPLTPKQIRQMQHRKERRKMNHNWLDGQENDYQ